jgi:hypothetical protein
VRGRVTLHAGQTIDPDSQEVDVAFTEAGRVLYEEQSAPGTFRQSRDRCARTWSAVHGTDVFRQRRATNGQCSGDVAFALAGRTENTPPVSTGARLRESVRVGEDCVTAVVECRAHGKSGRRLRCRAR